jgi:hypothetical protein
MEPLVITLHRAPGDTVVLTGLLRDLQRAYPGRFRVWADVGHAALLRHNPHVHRAGRWQEGVWPGDVLRVKAEYGRGIIRQKYEPVHFLSWFHRDFEARTGLHVPVTRPTPDLYLADEERVRPIAGRYWLLVAGGKSDVTVKIWSRHAWQRTADLIRGLGLGVVQCGSRAAGHVHFDLDGVLNLVGRTTLRDLVRLIHHADGVVCGVTAAMHIAAALDKPCVVVAGGREAWWWEAYVAQNKGFGPAAGPVPVPHKFLHTIGLLPCGHGLHGCWRNHVLPSDSRGLICHYPEEDDGQVIPRCLRLITADHVARAIMDYYEDRTLPPIDLPAAPEELTLIRPLAAPAPAPRLTPKSPPPPPDPAFDDPTIGGRLTAFVLLYGDYPEMHRHCLDALVLTTPRDRVEIRVLSNQLCAATARYVATLTASGVLACHYANPGNPGKYPAMRAAFRDPARPILTPYLLWFDDDTICDRDPHWLRRLVDLIVREHPGGARMFGPTGVATLKPGQADWIKSAPWYRGRPFRDKHGRDVPLGNHIHLVTGSFWALHVPTMHECDIPDPRIAHNGGDVMIGEQIHQLGHSFRAFSNGKSLVRWSASPRRGRSEPPAGTR